MTELTIKLKVFGGEPADAHYRSIDQVFGDEPLMVLLDEDDVECEIWCGDLRISGRALASAGHLKESLISNASTIMRQLQGVS